MAACGQQPCNGAERVLHDDETDDSIGVTDMALPYGADTESGVAG